MRKEQKSRHSRNQRNTEENCDTEVGKEISPPIMKR
jgi:hypothetical protein